MSYPRYISPAAGSTQQIAVSPAITPASPGLYCGFVSVPMVFADCNYDTHADKSSVAQAQPFLCSWIVVEQFVKLLTRLHLIEPFLLGPALIFSVISSTPISDFPERCPQRLGNSWSSM